MHRTFRKELRRTNMNDERSEREASLPQKGKGSRLVSLLNQGIQVLRKPPQGTTARGVGRSGDTQTIAEEVVVAPVQTDELLVNLARWVRRLIVPLAVLAWSGVVLLILWAAGHVTK